MYKLNIYSSSEVPTVKLEYKSLEKAKSDAVMLQDRTPEHKHVITSDGIRIWEVETGDNKNIFTL